MSKLYVCVGRKAIKPYNIEPIGLHVYTIEELCFYIITNAEMLDRDFMKEELVFFIEDELGLISLGSQLKQLVHFGGSLHTFCGLILEEACYRSPEQIKAIEEILKQNETMSTVMRKKNQADHMLFQREYYKALEAYGNLLLVAEEEEDNQMLADVRFQMGKATACLFYYDIAADHFMKSYKLGENKKSLKYYLMCKRLLMSKQQYIQMATETQEYYELALEVEQEYENAQRLADKRMELTSPVPTTEQLKKQFRQMTLE